jgi:predicted O-methyltransferase YrrM
MLLIKNKTLRQCLGVLETANVLFLKLLFKRPSAARLYPGVVFRDYLSLVRSEKWISRTVVDIVPAAEGQRIVLEHLAGGGIDTSIAELAHLALLTRAIAPKAIFEIGTFRGRTALNFALNSPDDCVVYTMDLGAEERKLATSEMNAADAEIVQHSLTGCDYRGKDVTHKINQLFGNSLEYDFSPYAGKIDLVFVDGAHHYDAVVSDTRNGLAMLRPGGYLVWHDFANYGDYNDVTRGVLDLLPSHEVIQIENTQLAVYRKPGE